MPGSRSAPRRPATAVVRDQPRVQRHELPLGLVEPILHCRFSSRWHACRCRLRAAVRSFTKFVDRRRPRRHPPSGNAASAPAPARPPACESPARSAGHATRSPASAAAAPPALLRMPGAKVPSTRTPPRPRRADPRRQRLESRRVVADIAVKLCRLPGVQPVNVQMRLRDVDADRVPCNPRAFFRTPTSLTNGPQARPPPPPPGGEGNARNGLILCPRWRTHARAVPERCPSVFACNPSVDIRHAQRFQAIRGSTARLKAGRFAHSRRRVAAAGRLGGESIGVMVERTGGACPQPALPRRQRGPVRDLTDGMPSAESSHHELPTSDALHRG